MKLAPNWRAFIELLNFQRSSRLRQAIGLRKDAKAAELARDLLTIGRDCARRLKEPYRTIDHGELLYHHELPSWSGDHQ